MHFRANQVKRAGCGITNFNHYRLRVLLDPGASGDQLPSDPLWSHQPVPAETRTNLNCRQSSHCKVRIGIMGPDQSRSRPSGKRWRTGLTDRVSVLTHGELSPTVTGTARAVQAL